MLGDAMARPSDLQAVCTRALQSVDAEFLDLARRHSLRAGSTVLCVLTRGAELCVFNVGDSRAVLARAPSSGDAAHPRAARGEPCLDAVRLSCDHSANLREEREAAQRRGAEVSRSGNDEDWRVVTYVAKQGQGVQHVPVVRQKLLLARVLQGLGPQEAVPKVECVV